MIATLITGGHEDGFAQASSTATQLCALLHPATLQIQASRSQIPCDSRMFRCVLDAFPCKPLEQTFSMGQSSIERR